MKLADFIDWWFYHEILMKKDLVLININEEFTLVAVMVYWHFSWNMYKRDIDGVKTKFKKACKNFIMKESSGGTRTCNENNPTWSNKKIKITLVLQIQDIEKHTNVMNIWNYFWWVTWSLWQLKILN